MVASSEIVVRNRSPLEQPGKNPIGQKETRNQVMVVKQGEMVLSFDLNDIKDLRERTAMNFKRLGQLMRPSLFGCRAKQSESKYLWIRFNAY